MIVAATKPVVLRTHSGFLWNMKQRQRAAKRKEAEEKAVASANSVGSDEKTTNDENIPTENLPPKSAPDEGHEKKRKNNQRKPSELQEKIQIGENETEEVPVVSPTTSVDSGDKKKKKRKRSKKKKDGAKSDNSANKAESTNDKSANDGATTEGASKEKDVPAIIEISPVEAVETNPSILTPVEEKKSSVEETMLSLLSNDFEKAGKKMGNKVEFVDLVDDSESDALGAILTSKSGDSVKIGSVDVVTDCMSSILSIDKKILPGQRSGDSLHNLHEDRKDVPDVEVPIAFNENQLNEEVLIPVRDNEMAPKTKSHHVAMMPKEINHSRNAFVPIDDDRVSSAETSDKSQNDCGCVIC